MVSRKLLAGLVIGAVLSVLIPGISKAADPVVRDTTRWPSASYVGLRLGTWIDQGGKFSDPNVTAEFNNVSFFTELFYDHRLMPWLFLEVSMAIASRGDVVFTYAGSRYIGTLNLYPMMAQIKLAPLGASRSFQPYLLGGGGVIVGKENTDIVQSFGPYIDPYYLEESKTALGYVVGAGVDIALSRQLGLTFAGKYHSIKFGSTLAGITDYSGTAVGVGLMYFIHNKKQHGEPWRRP